eukprot:SAG31_NODE_256_length_19032_cov_5.305181_3_plen_108_part_00
MPRRQETTKTKIIRLVFGTVNGLILVRNDSLSAPVARVPLATNALRLNAYTWLDRPHHARARAAPRAGPAASPDEGFVFLGSALALESDSQASMDAGSALPCSDSSC